MRKRNPFLPRVLETIINATIAFSRHPGRNPVNVYRIVRDFRELQDISDARLHRTIRYAIGKKYIKIDHSSIEVTEQGHKLLGREAIAALHPLVPERWGNLWYIVIFDIPEPLKAKRDGFAKSLKDIGFIQIQKSVFVFPHPCTEELEVLIGFYDVAPFVSTIVAKSISNDNEYRRIYSLGNHVPRR